MTYVELDISNEVYDRLEKLSNEEGISVEELIVDIIEDELSLEDGEEGIEEDEDLDYTDSNEDSFDN